MQTCRSANSACRKNFYAVEFSETVFAPETRPDQRVRRVHRWGRWGVSLVANSSERGFSVGRRGPAPQPASLRLMNGVSEGRDSGGRRVGPPGKGFICAAPPKPADLSAKASEIWDAAVADLERIGSLKLSDGPALEMMSEAGATWFACRERVRKVGRNVTRPSGVVVLSPIVADMRRAEADYRSWVREFGLTHSAQLRLAAPAAGQVDGRPNPFGSVPNSHSGYRYR
jgi:P27 family predicted phage terminase small subunit